MLKRWRDMVETELPALVPLFPITSFEPGSRCPHHGRIKRGSRFVCMCCHQSGLDHLAMPGRIDRTPEGRSEAEITADAHKQKTRKAGVRRVTVNVDSPNLN
jgi:hypothetical protein